jgi:N-methylhydantoinase A
VPISLEPAALAFERAVARRLGLPLQEAAFGVYELAAATMTRAVKAVSTYRGRDPRRFALIAFGGNGPVVAPAIARALEMSVVLVPPAPGVFSAAGLLFYAAEREAAPAVFRRVVHLDPAPIEAGFAALEAEARAGLEGDGHERSAITLRRLGDFRYAGQAYELTVPCDGGLAAAVETFHAEHERTYGYRSESESVDLVNIKVLAAAPPRGADEAGAHLAPAPGGHRAPSSRRAFFGRAHGHIDTPVIDRADLPARAMAGPVIIEEYDATCVVPPGTAVRLDDGGNIEIRLP